MPSDSNYIDWWREPNFFKKVSNLQDPDFNITELLERDDVMIDRTKKGAAWIGHLYILYHQNKTNKIYVGLTCNTADYRKSTHLDSCFLQQSDTPLYQWMREVIECPDPQQEKRNNWNGIKKPLVLCFVKNIHLPHLIAESERTGRYPTETEKKIWRDMMAPYETELIRQLPSSRLLNAHKTKQPQRTRRSYNRTQLLLLLQKAKQALSLAHASQVTPDGVSSLEEARDYIAQAMDAAS
jgi:hypothetical protein